MAVPSNPSPKEVALTFLNLIGQNDNEASEEIAEIFGRAHQAFRSKKLSKQDDRLRWLLDRWVRALRLDASDWRSTILLRGLLVEDMLWSQLAHLLKLSQARVRSIALDSLLDEVSSEDLLNRPTRDCARNDLYLIDVLTRQNWLDSLGIYPKSYFDTHLSECERCRRVFDKAEAYRTSLIASRKQQVPRYLDWDSVEASEGLAPGVAAARFSLPLRVGATLGLAVLIFVGVSSAPYIGQYWDYKKVASLVGDSTPLESPPETQQVLPQDPLGDLPRPPQVAIVDPPSPPSVLSEFLQSPAPPLSATPAQIPNEERSGLAARILNFFEEKTRNESTPEPAPTIVAKAAPPVPDTKPASGPVASAPEPAPVLAPPKPVKTAVSAETTRVFFRWGARAQDPERMTQKILGWLVELNAENAGELEFGARYRGGRYFHFMVPRSAYADLLAKIKTLPLTDFSDAAAESDRSINADLSRIVFWVGPTNQ